MWENVKVKVNLKFLREKGVIKYYFYEMVFKKLL